MNIFIFIDYMSLVYIKFDGNNRAYNNFIYKEIIFFINIFMLGKLRVLV